MRPLVHAVMRNVQAACGGCRTRWLSTASSSGGAQPITTHLSGTPPTTTQSTITATSSDAAELTITDRCAEHLKKIVSPGECLRVSVDGGGCSGFEYKISIDSSVNNDDRVFEKNGAKVLVDELSMSFVKGATIDYVEELIRSAFRVTNNPVAEKGCSCGSSFAVRMD
uniref:Iron-sulfur cluster assembly 2 homolog, mitochondrial n=1 Tax=Plectus sambesii TaxID=2011161 RepID=A0A914XCN7_9BILA